MRKKSLMRMAMHIIASAGCVTSFLIIAIIPLAHVKAAPQIPVPVPHTGFLEHSRADAGIPVRLRIPSIHVDAAIEAVGLTAKSAMDVPDNPANVGWYDRGSRPGENGSAVLAGHLNWYGGKTAVFQHLNSLRAGDVVSIETDRGRFLLFIVREIRTYQNNEYAQDVFQNHDGRHLNLVTCDGVWDPAKKMYDKRMVVFADAAERE